jgi:hypothetical protein
MDAGNMGLLDSISMLLNDSSALTAAMNINNSIIDTNNVEYYSKIVNEIHLNYLATGELTASDSATLDYIAHLPLSLAGTAIYSAAAHLGIEIHQQYSSQARQVVSNPPKEKVLTEHDVFMYPNPAFDKAYFYLAPLANEKIVLIEIYDNGGNKIMMHPVRTENMLLARPDMCYVLDVRSFAAGNYAYRVICNGKEFKGTFVKAK